MYRYSNIPSAILRYIIYPSASFAAFHVSLIEVVPVACALRFFTSNGAGLAYLYSFDGPSTRFPFTFLYGYTR